MRVLGASSLLEDSSMNQQGLHVSGRTEDDLDGSVWRSVEDGCALLPLLNYEGEV